MPGFPFPSRRSFIKSAIATSVGGPLLLSKGRSAQIRNSANDRIQLGFIGVGVMGGGHVSGFLRSAQVQVVAVCDVVRERREHHRKIVNDYYAKNKKGDFKGCQAYEDFRALLDNKAVDAVLIATPDHWHAITCVFAAKAHKDIYSEKPLTLNVAEGRKVVGEAAKGHVIFQTGSQQRSEFGGRFRKAVELVRNGCIGTVKTIRIGVGGPAVACDLPEQAVPDGTDWNFWLGPSPLRGYNEILCPKGVHKHFPNWRSYREYGGGGIADMGAHHFDIAQWALDMDGSGPVLIEPPTDPKATKGLRYTYANGVVMIHDEFEGERADCLFEGTKGKIFVSRDMLKTEPAGILAQLLDANGFRAYPSKNHHQNWLDCLRSRKETICPAEVGHRSATICHLGNIGYRLRRPLHWDPAKEQFAGDAEANALLTREMRAPWTI
ncbi:MAG TPA: Gfo/Idh/MocA family oxidoreductase [Gemmataceae bacterium]|nr:Gfo/Idh/MocA family oxidoreductase [Gemmataceae bacterium]